MITIPLSWVGYYLVIGLGSALGFALIVIEMRDSRTVRDMSTRAARWAVLAHIVVWPASVIFLGWSCARGFARAFKAGWKAANAGAKR